MSIQSGSGYISGSFYYGVMGDNTDITAKVNTDPEDPVIDNTGCCYDPVNDTKIYNCVLSDDLRFISGYTEEGTKARYSFEYHKWYYGADIKKLYLVPFNKRDPEEAKLIQSMGGKTTQANINNQRSLNDIAKRMLNSVLTKNQVDEILGDAVNLLGEDRSAGSVMIAKMIQTAMAGSFKAAEFVRDTAGYKPKNEVDISADIMTDEDRSLIDKLNKRLTG